MIYKNFKGLKISALGYGAMRFPVIDGNDSDIEKQAATELIDKAMASGINYYDTAWGYHNGNSEYFLGESLSKYPRESYYLASKFPGYDLKNLDKIDEIFTKQLEKCKTEYFDFYLFHNVCETNVEEYISPEYGLMDYLQKQKAAGKIRHIGFSTHGNYDKVKKFLDAYGSELEFCQIQLNWLDWSLQEAESKVELLREYNMPIWVMEPLRGGRLANLSDENIRALKALRPDETIPGWSFRFLQSFPEITVILSGMSTMQQLNDNLKTFETEEALSDKEKETLYEIARGMIGGVPCTGCHYCTNQCPMELDIPKLMTLYNEYIFTNGSTVAVPRTIKFLPENKKPSACLGCRSCESVCPQNIKISEVLADLSEKVK